MKYLILLFLAVTPLGAQNAVLWGGIHTYSDKDSEAVGSGDSAVSHTVINKLKKNLEARDLMLVEYVSRSESLYFISDKEDMDSLDGYLSHQYRYGIYGFNRKSSNFFDVEIRIYDFLVKNDVKTFYFRYEIDDMQALTDEIGVTLKDYLLTVFRYFEEQIYIDQNDQFRLTAMTGYWTYLLNDLFDYDLPLFTAGFKTEYIPGIRVKDIQKVSLFPSFGYHFSFFLSKTKNPDTNFDHTLSGFQQTLPVLLNVKIPGKLTLYAGAAPGFLIECFIQDRGDDGDFTSFSTNFVLSINTGVHLYLGESKSWFMGLDLEPQFVFYSEGCRSRLNFNITAGYVFDITQIKKMETKNE